MQRSLQTCLSPALGARFNPAPEHCGHSNLEPRCRCASSHHEHPARLPRNCRSKCSPACAPRRCPQVLIVDPNPRAPWVNNFGVWIDEFELMGLADCLDVTWDKALVHLDATPEGKR